MAMSRRHFLGRAAAGSVALTVPAVLAGCAAEAVRAVAQPTPADPFLDWFGIDAAAIQRLMSALTANGADFADIYFQHRQSGAFTMTDGQLLRSDTDVIQGVGMRVVVGEQVGFAHTELLSPESMLQAARAAAAAAKSGDRPAAPETPVSLAAGPPGSLYAIDVPWSDVGADRKLELMRRADEAARAADTSVSGVSVSFADVDEHILIATLDGRLRTDRRPMTRLSVQVRANRNGEQQSGFASVAAREGLPWYGDERIQGAAREAVDRTLMLFEARRAPSGELPVILAGGGCGVLLHEAIGHSLEADFNHRGLSPYAGMMDQAVASPMVTIVDQGTLPRQRGSLNFDDEGTDCGRNVLVEDGVLRSYLHDAVSARQYGAPVTGTARRQSYQHVPMPRMTCTFIERGSSSRDEIVESVKYGVLAENITDGSVQLGEGGFEFHVRNGWLVENGRLTVPLKDIALTGNGPQTLSRIEKVADDLAFDSAGWTCGKNGQSVPVSQGMPTVLVSALEVAPRAVRAAPGASGTGDASA